jgi:hypothetical protein
MPFVNIKNVNKERKPYHVGNGNKIEAIGDDTRTDGKEPANLGTRFMAGGRPYPLKKQKKRTLL